MITVNDLITGISGYLDEEFLPKLEKGGLKRVLIGTVMAMALNNLESQISKYKDNTYAQMLGIFNDKGLIDIDTIKKELCAQVKANDGLKIDLKGLEIVLREADIEKMYSYITGVKEKS